MSAILKEDNLHCRLMTTDDIDAVFAIETQTYEFPWSLGIFRDCLRVGYLCRVLERQGAVEGYSILSHGAGEAHILNLCIQFSMRRLGAGRFMLNQLIADAKKLKADTLLLEVRQSNHAAISLYLHAGFNEIGLREDYYPAKKGREDALLLAMDLSSDNQISRNLF